MINYRPLLTLLFKRYQRPTAKDAIIQWAVKTAVTFIVAGTFLGVAGNAVLARDTLPKADGHSEAAKRMEKEKPVNWPTYEDRKTVGAELCGVETGKAVLRPTSEVKVATHVVVVKLNGVMMRMDMTEAWDRAQSKTKADDVWTIGVCKKDILDRVHTKVVG